MSTKKRLLSVRLDDEVIIFLDEGARRLGLSRNAYIQMILKLKREEEQKETA